MEIKLTDWNLVTFEEASRELSQEDLAYLIGAVGKDIDTAYADKDVEKFERVIKIRTLLYLMFLSRVKKVD